LPNPKNTGPEVGTEVAVWGSESPAHEARPRLLEEEKMTSIFARLVTDDRGQDLAEYGIALGVIGVLAGVVAVVIAADVGTLWSRSQHVIDSAAS
jgi:Flp pilus assembly pilin Flp